jgi:hypothetical protein
LSEEFSVSEVSRNATSEAQKRATKKWRENHPEDYNAYMREYRHRNRERINERQRNYLHRQKEFWANVFLPKDTRKLAKGEYGE